MQRNDRYIACARAIRPHLSDLIGSTDALALDSTLSSLIVSGQQGQDVADLIAAALARYPGTQQWADTHMQGTETDERNVKGYDTLSSNSSAVPARRYMCPSPNCDYKWSQRTAGEVMRLCPTHKLPLRAV